MIPHAVRQQLNAAHAVGDYRPLLALIPYAGLSASNASARAMTFCSACRPVRTTSATRCCPLSMVA